MVFVATKHHVEYLKTLLEADGIPCACVYGAMDQTARKINVAKFKAQRVSILIVTDVAARGIDIPLLDHVVNYDFPPKPKLFVHRVGRAGRAGRTGTAHTMCTPDEVPYVVDLHAFLGLTLRAAHGKESLGLTDRAEQTQSSSSSSSSHFSFVVTVQEAQEGAATRRPSYLGIIPPALLTTHLERVRDLRANAKASIEIRALEKPMANAFKLYLKTRPGATRHSVRACREGTFKHVASHPELVRLFLVSDAAQRKDQDQDRDQGGGDDTTRTCGGGGGRFFDLEGETKRLDLLRQMQQFRPSATVFEAAVAPNRRGEGAGALGLVGVRASINPLTDFTQVMKRKREQGAGMEQERRRRKEEALAEKKKRKEAPHATDEPDHEGQGGGGRGGGAAAAAAASALVEDDERDDADGFGEDKNVE